jgi:hypothetical protein
MEWMEMNGNGDEQHHEDVCGLPQSRRLLHMKRFL